MGKLLSKEEKRKEGRLYEDIKDEIKTLDLLLFRGGDIVSDVISLLEEKYLGNNAGEYTHVGMAVRGEDLEYKYAKEGEVYVFESTMGGPLGDGTKNVEGKSFFGVQLRSLKDVVETYDAPHDTCIAVAKLHSNPVEDPQQKEETLRSFNERFHELNGTGYDWNFYSLFAAIFPRLRKRRAFFEKKLNTEDHLFCSEMCFTIYQILGVYPTHNNNNEVLSPKDVLPADFMGFDKDGMPFDKFGKPKKIVSKKWYSKHLEAFFEQRDK